ncbi:hypothetical protein [Aquamicrobium defluvii]|uniref:Uncharacterized protein n=1 Tax=Aquamicrobium defluvii TaxID=69279 RepID=A0A4R6YGQ5_9HYPH|nr:hypothetical protein [Aquamicrobium defluvii]TDR35723.1 hypothetical protein DES43_108148 [Aquamicrobium defluvii]
MTPKMLQALSEAAQNNLSGGLHRSNAGWASKRSIAHWHNFRTVEALVARGYLEIWGGGCGVKPYACITTAGTLALKDLGYGSDGQKDCAA